MAPHLADLIRALPEVDTEGESDGLATIPRPESLRPVPIGRWRRFALLGTLQAQITAGYLFYWLRGWFHSADERQRHLAETHWRSAVRILNSMGYLRGAVMKVGQTLANFPDIAPQQLVETLEQLHYNAPPMHWSLLRELVANELEGEPEKLFAEFDTRAFAAASLGQVHRARLHSGEEVAVKIQYPGIGRTITDDFRNLQLFLFPNRLGSDWENMRAQFDDLRERLEQETDYEAEADHLERARALFQPDDGIHVPRVYRHYSTKRILTMERMGGVHLDAFLQRQPTQEERDAAATKMIRAWYRLMYSGRMLYNDFHPGNFLFQEDGGLGLIDFGHVVDLDDELWELFRIVDRPLTTGRREDRIEAMKAWSGLVDEQSDQMRLYEQFAEWNWRARPREGVFDFGDEADFREGVELFTQMLRRRYSRGHRVTPTITRGHFGWRSLLYRLRAQIAIQPLAEAEVQATGWDRANYAPPSVD